MQSSPDTRRIYNYGFEYSLGIDGFRPIWFSLWIKALVNQVKFLKPPGYSNVINYAQQFFLFASTAL